MKRKEVYKIIDGERDYQDKKWGGKEHDETHSIDEWINYMIICLGRACKADTFDNDSEKALDELRQVIALGIACFEIHGVPDRVKPLHDEYV